MLYCLYYEKKVCGTNISLICLGMTSIQFFVMFQSVIALTFAELFLES